MKTAVITGLGVASALGSSVEEFWQNLLAGKSGFRAVENISLPKRGCRIAAEVLIPPREELDSVNPQPRAVELALFAAREAWKNAGFDESEIDRERIAVIVGTGIGNQDIAEFSIEKLQAGERLSPLTAFRSFAHSAACEILREFDLRGAVQTVSSGCNSGADAIGLALDWIRLGRCDAVLVGGTEAEINASFYGAMTAARALTTKFNNDPAAASRPFDARRDGNAPGEGAGFLILESADHALKRRAKVRAKLLGFANCGAGTRPAYDPFNPIFDTAPMLRTMRTALKDAGLSAKEVSAVSANGSSSVFYDPLEAKALYELLGETPSAAPVFSIKGALGQTGAVTPALQAIAAVLSLETGILPPTANTEDQDLRCQIKLVGKSPYKLTSKAILCNAIGFGGFYYASTVFGT
jgi:3-oxoacyl-[acyl-carrier-protein] synthase II